MREVIDFFLITDRAIWQHVVLVSIIIPLVLSIYSRMKFWITNFRPLNRLFNGYKLPNSEVLIFLSQLSGSNNTGGHNPNQKYISFFPSPLPTDRNNLGHMGYQNIDPVWAESDGSCVADVFNVLGRLGNTNNFRIADTIKDWNKRTNPTITIGFNPKTRDFLNECHPISFNGFNEGNMQIEGSNISLNAVYPNDAGIIQKTFINGFSIPVFILAGHGTTGTSAAGYVLNQNCLAFGKLYGKKAFCVMFKTDITKGRNYYEIMAIYPKPNFLQAVLYPLTFLRWRRKKIFPN